MNIELPESLQGEPLCHPYPTLQHKSWVEAVLANDNLRHPFSDWLEEQGDEWFEEVRAEPIAIWTTEQGTTIPVRYMSDQHLLATIHMLDEHLWYNVVSTLLTEALRRNLQVTTRYDNGYSILWEDQF